MVCLHARYGFLLNGVLIVFVLAHVIEGVLCIVFGSYSSALLRNQLQLKCQAIFCIRQCKVAVK